MVKKEDFEELGKKFVEKYGKIIIGLPGDFLNFLKKKQSKNYKKIIDYNKYFKSNNNKEEYSLFSFLINGIIGETFFKNENSKVLNEVIIGPYLIENYMGPVSLFLNKKRQVEIKKTNVIAFYNDTKNKFMWTYPDTMKELCQIYKFMDFTFCKVNAIDNIRPNEADSLALWYRSLIYIMKNISPSNFLYKEFKTTNLALFQFNDKGDIYTAYCIVDFGIPDPKYTGKLKEAFDIFMNSPQEIKQMKMKPKMKGRLLNGIKVSNKSLLKDAKTMK